MNEIIIVDRPGDSIDTLIAIGMRAVKIPTVSYVVFSFNGIKLFIKKDTSKKSLMKEYLNKIQAS